MVATTVGNPSHEQMNRPLSRRLAACGAFLLILSAFAWPARAAIPQIEREALIALYNSTNGDGWTDKPGWKTPPLHTDGFAMPGTEETWYGITVASDHVSHIQLYENNLTGGIPAQLGNLTNLQGLYLYGNQLTGGIPTQLGNLTNLQYFDLEGNQLTSSIPSQLGNLTNLQQLWLQGNQFTGSIPSQLGNLTNLQYLDLEGNQLTGGIPTQLGNLTNLESLLLDNNQLTGGIPTELGNLTKLQAEWLDLRWNALYTTDSALRAFLNSKQEGGDWESTQTVAPTGVTAGSPTATSLTVSWTPIAYTDDTGGYRVFYSASSSGGPYTLFSSTANKSASSLTVTGLAPSSGYYFVVQTQTAPHSWNQNTVVSEQSAPPAFGTTGPACTAPSISASPANQQICSGETADLSVTVSGSAPLHYQWYRGAAGNTTDPVGTDSPDFTTPALTGTTSFWVRVTNDCGSADSAAATITVRKPPAITAHPQSQTILSGQTATLTVEASGSTPLHYD